ncbi:restriction endonuclease subunit S [Leptospira bandrabouensis]|uniref:restriction endonuclease subunit S n=1 Tax=Leptospira bandrabouensis TaxID=2484903 RepID=UPI00223E6E4E|nr:restriction endonuclease subunit S [Leptospira bandrabouensis]MCW7460413.1 restriction endonuclease subunit S [Leptospira bandrabouensis]MCW7479399.1 restriction endonuclease subunit S [Leptospira bandrabouensis]MCW7487084.1 restriction endonuclease subunit S [Leptospira bandrabouensis]
MKVQDLFWIYSGNKLDFQKQVIDESGTNFVSRNSNNNGVVGKIAIDPSIEKFKAGDISVPLGGSYLLTCFVQDEEFVTAQNVSVLRPKIKLSPLEKWFYCYALRENRFKYTAFGREVNKYLKDIDLPDSIPSWVKKGNISEITTENKRNTLKLEYKNWKYFNIGGPKGIFSIEQCKCSNASSLLEDGDEINYIGAKKDNNGVIKKVKIKKELVSHGNSIIFICDGQGSVGYTNYTEEDFIGSTTLSIGRNEKLNKYNALFLVTILDQERYRYSFGRKYKSNLAKAKIFLPSKNNEPDWQYMEEFIKSMPYADKL